MCGLTGLVVYDGAAKSVVIISMYEDQQLLEESLLPIAGMGGQKDEDNLFSYYCPTILRTAKMPKDPTISNKALAIRRSWDFGSMSFQMAAQHATTKPNRKMNITHGAIILIF